MVYVWLGLCAALVAPSPKAQLHVYGGVPPVALPANDTGSGTFPLVGAPLALAVRRGGCVLLSQMSVNGSPSAAWSAARIGNVEPPIAPFASMIPGATLFITRSMSAITLVVL